MIAYVHVSDLDCSHSAVTKMMHEIFRVLKPGGRFITFSLHSASSILKYFQDFNVKNSENVLYLQRSKHRHSAAASASACESDPSIGDNSIQISKTDRVNTAATRATVPSRTPTNAQSLCSTYAGSVTAEELGWRISTYSVKTSRWQDTSEDRRKSVAHTLIVCDKVTALVDDLSPQNDVIASTTVAVSLKGNEHSGSSGSTSVTDIATHSSEGLDIPQQQEPSDCSTTAVTAAVDSLNSSDLHTSHTSSTRSADTYTDHSSFHPFPVLPPDHQSIPGTLDDHTHAQLRAVALLANLKASMRDKRMTTQKLMQCLSRAVDLYEYASSSQS